MSRDMLSYEPREIERYGCDKSRLRLIAPRYVQNASLKSADGAVFLTKYAADVIQQSCGPLKKIAYIPHGVRDAFRGIKPESFWPTRGERPIQCLYVSNAALYKHQWHVVKAIELLHKKL